jgi:hypothetical protein
VTKSRRKHRGKSSRSGNGPQPKHAAAPPVRSWRDRLFDPIDIASVAVFRIALGLLLFRDMFLLLSSDGIKSYYLDPPYLFPFFGFEFLRPLPGNGMYLLFIVLMVCTLLITLGLFYRVAMAIFVAGFTYIFLLEQALYLNHFYFAGLLGFLMIFVPAARGWSLDALIAGRSQDARIPTWSLWILRAQMEVMLLYAGIVKLNPDWLQGEPLGKWLAQSADLPIVGPWLLNDTIVLMGAWGSAFLHLIGAVMLLFKSTRIYAFVLYCCFHLSNAVFFDIGIFPWLTIAATTLFFDPDWPKVVWRKVTGYLRLSPSSPIAAPSGGSVQSWSIPSPAMRMTIVSLLLAWIAVQILVPNRHLLWPGYTGWTEQGYYFSWQMMLRQKMARAVYYVRDPDTNREWIVDPRHYLRPMQVNFLVKRPEMMRQFAHYLEREWATRYGTRDIEVRVFTAASLNGRRAQTMIDPTRDLTKIGYSLANSNWILPLKEPMPPKGKRWPMNEKKVLLQTMNADPAMRRLLANRENQKVSVRPSDTENK